VKEGFCTDPHLVQSLSGKVLLLTLLPVVLFFLLNPIFIIPKVKKEILAQKQSAMREVVDTVFSLMDQYEQEVQAGRLTREQAKAMATRQIAAIHFDGQNYVTVLGKDGVLLIQKAQAVVLGGATSVQVTLENLGAIQERITQIAGSIQEVGGLSREQAGTSQEVAGMMDQTNSRLVQNAASTHELAATVGEIAHTAEELARVASGLKGVVNQFRH